MKYIQMLRAGFIYFVLSASLVAAETAPTIDVELKSNLAIPLLVPATIEKQEIPGSKIDGKEWIKEPPKEIDRDQVDADGSVWHKAETFDEGNSMRSGRWTKKPESGSAFTRHYVWKIVKPAGFSGLDSTLPTTSPLAAPVINK